MTTHDNTAAPNHMNLEEICDQLREQRDQLQKHLDIAVKAFLTCIRSIAGAREHINLDEFTRQLNSVFGDSPAAGLLITAMLTEFNIPQNVMEEMIHEFDPQNH